MYNEKYIVHICKEVVEGRRRDREKIIFIITPTHLFTRTRAGPPFHSPRPLTTGPPNKDTIGKPWGGTKNETWTEANVHYTMHHVPQAAHIQKFRKS